MTDLVVVNANVWTHVAGAPRAQAVAVAAGRIAAVGSNSEIQPLAGPDTRIIDGEGRLLVPGFNDAHAHLIPGGMHLLGVDLRPAKDEREFVSILADYAAGMEAGRWITGGCWDHEAWPSRKRPTKELIDPVTGENPVLVCRLDGHIALANSVALKLASITRETADPKGGHIERDEQTHEPTGILIDKAIGLAASVIPEPTEQHRLDAALAALRHAAEAGVTSVQAPCSADDFGIFQRLRRAGELTARVYAMVSDAALDAMEQLRLQASFGDAYLRAGAVKMFADGSLGAGSALMFEPYDDDPSTAGLAIHDAEELCELVRRADAVGLQVALHAIGDKAVHWALNAFERALEANGRRDARHRIEHAQIIAPADVERFAVPGVVASLQPSHWMDDMRWLGRRIGARLTNCGPYRSLAEAGARVALGSDWYVEPLDPMASLYGAVAPREVGQQVSMHRALLDYTLGSAFAEFQEHHKGAIAPDMLADMVLLSRDIFEPPHEQIPQTKAEMTVVGGRVVFPA